MLFRIAILVIAIYILFKIIKKTAISALKGPPDRKEIKESSELVQCSHCSSFFDKKVGLLRGNRQFCNLECQDKYFKDRK